MDLPIEAFELELVGWLGAQDAPDVSDVAFWSRRFGEAGLLAPAWAP